MNDFFFMVSKIAWGLLSPTNVLILIFALGTLQLMRNKISAAKKILLSTLVVSLLILVYPLGDKVMYPLESRFSKPIVLPERVDGIIVLGGGESLKLSVAWDVAELGDGADRFMAAAFLAKQYPDIPVIFSGGSGLLRFNTTMTGGDIAYEVLTTMGIDKERLIIESKSRNTHENFVLLKESLPKPQGQYLLITSAFHMPRSVGIANKHNINVIAYPVDYRSTKPQFRQWGFNLFEHLTVLEPAWREWIGLTVYYWTGKTTAWFPAP